MAMVKCKSCYSMTSDSKGVCSYCGEKLFVFECPNCKSTNITFTAKRKKTTGSFAARQFGFLGALFASNLEETAINYVCKDCGKKFKLK